MKRLLKIMMILVMMTSVVGCQQDDVIIEITNDQKELNSNASAVSVSMNLNFPALIKMGSRSSDVQNITLLCFDEGGNLKASPFASLVSTDGAKTTITAMIPNSTRIIHLLANQFESDDQVVGIVKESDIISYLANSGSMIFWGRVVVPEEIKGKDKLAEWLSNQTVSLLRNQAKVKVEVENNKEGFKDFVVTGFSVINTESQGTIAPYSVDKGTFPTHASTTFTLDNWAESDYINLLSQSNITDVNDVQVNGDGEIYVYETAKDQNASIIIEGYNAFAEDKTPKYWRVAFADSEGNSINVRRNHLYTVKICGVMPDNCAADNFTDAKTIETSNMAWLLIDEEITAISDTKVSLNIERSKIIVSDFDVSDEETKFVKATFHIQHLDNTSFDVDKLIVKWENIENTEDISIVKGDNCELVVGSDGKTAVGTIKILRSDLELNDDIYSRKGNIVIRYGNRLQRVIKIEAVQKSNFSILKYNDEEEYSEISNVFVFNVPIEKDKYQLSDYTVDDLPIDKLVFSIPDDCPCEIPFNIYISTNDFNVIDTYIGGNDNDFDYKYVYRVTHKGQHEIKLRYIKNDVSTENSLKLEADHFENVEIKINYTWSENN